MIDVVLEEALEKLLSTTELATMALQPYVSAIPGAYADIRDGSLYKSHAFVQAGTQNVFYFLLYGDDVELNCPIGAFRGDKKFCFYYWTLVNLPPSELACSDPSCLN